MVLSLWQTAEESEVGGADGHILMLFESFATFAQRNFWAVVKNGLSNSDRFKEHNYTQTWQNWQRAGLLTWLDWYFRFV